MSFLSKIFGKTPPLTDAQASSPNNDEKLIPVPIPPLGVLLLNLEKQKGTPLTESEMVEASDKAVCMMLPLSVKAQMDEKRGYRDIDPSNVWVEWLVFKAKVKGNLL